MTAPPDHVVWLRQQGVPTFVPPDERRVATPLRRPRAYLATVVVLGVLGALVLAVSPYRGVLATGWGIAVGVVLVLVVSWVVLAAQIPAVLAFSLRWFLRTLLRSDSNLLHVLPLLLVAVTFFFLTAETWQSVGTLSTTPYTLALLLLLAVTVGFILRRERADTEELSSFADAEELREALPPALRRDVPAEAVRTPPLRLAERVNVVVLSVVGKVVATALVSLAVTGFFLVLGALVVTRDTAEAWAGRAPEPWWSATLGGDTYAVTVAHLQVAAFLGVFAGLYFVVSSASDRELAKSLSSDTDGHLRACFAVRAAYRTDT